ncbi:MipA/OmpV family protein [Vibrio sp.]|uniref:MipA/OmpV family protein n=1 Tax=Vibrio sp. TaxID=678 RepID=UPI003D1529A6
MKYLPLVLITLGVANGAVAGDTYIRNGQIYNNEGGWIAEFGASYASDLYKQEKSTYKFGFGSKNRFGPVLNAGYHGEDFNFDLRGGVNYRFFGETGDAVNLSAYVGSSGIYRDKDLADSLKGTDKRYPSLDLGLNMDLQVAPQGTLSSYIQHDVSGQYKSYVAGMRYYQIINIGKVDFVPFAGIRYNSAKFNNHYFGINKKEATKTRPLYEAKAGFNYELGYKLVVPLSENWSVSQKTTFTRLSKQIANSPVVEGRNQWMASVLASYRF